MVQDALDASRNDLLALEEQKAARVEELACCRDEAQALLSSAAQRVEELSEARVEEPAGEVAGGKGGDVDSAAQQASGQVEANAADGGVTFDDVSPDGDASAAARQTGGADGGTQADGGQDGSASPTAG